MRAGELNRTITLEAQAETVAPSGAVATAWAPFATVRAKITDALEEDAAADPQAPTTARLLALIRYRADVTTGHRLTYRGRSYAITRTVEIGRKRGLELHAVAS